jgi:hypothetical protein
MTVPERRALRVIRAASIGRVSLGGEADFDGSFDEMVQSPMSAPATKTRTRGQPSTAVRVFRVVVRGTPRVRRFALSQQPIAAAGTCCRPLAFSRARASPRASGSLASRSIANRYVACRYDVFYLWRDLSQGLFHREVSP